MNPISSQPRVPGRRIAVLGAVIASLVTAGAGAGYWYGRHSAAPAVAQDYPLPWGHTGPRVTGVGSGADVDALAERLWALEGEVLRLDALGQRLVAMAGLDADEFAFGSSPAVGGPADPDADTGETSVPAVTEESELLLALFSDRTSKLQEIERALRDKDLRGYAIPSIWPVESGYISSKFGYRRHPILKRTRFHSGVDFACKPGTPVHATAEGVVTFSGWQSGYGRLVEILHPGGLVTRYGHNQENLVAEGDRVRKGQAIAKVGSTGRSTGPHVHFEVRDNGRPVDPLSYVGTEPPKAKG